MTLRKFKAGCFSLPAIPEPENNDLRCGDICSLRQDKRRTARRKYDEKPVCRRRGGNIRGIYVCISGRAVYDPKKPGIYARGKAENADGKIRLVKETSKVSLIMPDGKEFQGKKREVDQKIEQIIGLDAGQFTQIAMIAQGDFLRLLHAESKERKKIFSKIFRRRYTETSRNN